MTRARVTAALVSGLVALATAAPSAPARGAGTGGDCAEPAVVEGDPGDASRDAAGRGQILEQIDLPGITDVALEDGNGGLATVDLDGNGLLDLVTVAERAPLAEALRVHLNQGCFDFSEAAIELRGVDDVPAGNHAIPVFADFDGDGLLDIYLTGDPTTDAPRPNLLLLARGDHLTYEEVGRPMGIANETSYSRQAAVADIDEDGWLDIAVAADQIGDGRFRPGLPWQRLYLYRPAAGSTAFEDGRFEDIGGTEVIPGFGGEPTGEADHDLSSPTILLRDLNDDGDIDLVQSYHLDMVLTPWTSPNGNDERHHGVFVWESLLADTGELRFKQQPPSSGSLAEEGWSTYDPVAGEYVPEQHAVSHAYLSSADIDNDGDLDVLTVGATDLYWHIHTDQVAAKLWRNDGPAGFTPATEEVGLEALNWVYDEWYPFWDAPPGPPMETQYVVSCQLSSNQKQRCLEQGLGGSQMYHADSVWADLNNDGWIDLVAVDRHEFTSGYGKFRNILFLNQGDGTFEPVPTDVSGLDENSIAAETTDLDGDGLLDLYLMKDIRNTSPAAKPATVPHGEFTDTVYWNTGEHGGATNHWLVVELTGRPDRELIGSTLRLFDRSGRLLGRRDLFPVTSYKTTVALRAHFGLGEVTDPVLEAELPDGSRHRIDGLGADQVVTVDVSAPGTLVDRQPVDARRNVEAAGLTESSPPATDWSTWPMRVGLSLGLACLAGVAAKWNAGRRAEQLGD